MPGIQVMIEPHEVLFWAITLSALAWLIILIDNSPDDPV